METATRRGRRGATDDVVDAEADADAAAAATLEATSERAEAILAASGEAMARPSMCGSFGFAERGRQREREKRTGKKVFLKKTSSACVEKKRRKKKQSIEKKKGRAFVFSLARSLPPDHAPHGRQPREDGTVYRGAVEVHDAEEEEERRRRWLRRRL